MINFKTFLLSVFSIVVLNFSIIAQTKRALLIGIDEYRPNQQTPAPMLASRDGNWQNLDGCVNDANSIREIIINRYGFESEMIKMVLNQEATRANLVSEINKLIEVSEKGDIVFVFYAGHGSQIKNSKSYDGTGKDQTIVPSDMNDLRSKELAVLWNQLIDKGVRLTLIFDSCHSGSIARGNPLPSELKCRKMPPVDLDVMDSTKPQNIYERGALVFSAAQREQTAKERNDDNNIPHGAFTLSLIQAIASTSINESAGNIFKSTESVLRSRNVGYQDPLMDATEQRKKRGLFDEEVNMSYRTTLIPVISTLSSDNIVLSGGFASALNKGCILRKVTQGADSATIKIDSVLTIGKSKASLLSGDIRSIVPGNLFECILWTCSDKPNLKVWFPNSDLKTEELKLISKNLINSKTTSKIEWIEDPTFTAPDYFLRYNQGSWTLSGPDNYTYDFGDSISTDLLIKKVPEKARVNLQLPPPVSLINSIKLGEGTENTAIEITKNPSDADYILTGTYKHDSLFYAWIRPFEIENDRTYQSTLPVRSDWYFLEKESIRQQVTEVACRLGVINAWLNLASPFDSGKFPFVLALKKAGSDEFTTSGMVHKGEKYNISLITDKNKLEHVWDGGRRFVYVFVIDKFGETTQLYPETGLGNDRNYIPDNLYDNEVEIPLKNKLFPFTISEPFGFDTYFLLTTNEAINNFEAFNAKGVRGRKLTKSNDNPLSNLISNVGANTRGGESNIPVNWNIQKLVIRSLPE